MILEFLQIFIIYSILLLAVMLLAEFAYKYIKLPTEWTRKIAHIGSGIVALTYPNFIHSHWVVFALTISFMVILYTSKKMGIFQSIFSIGRKSSGEIFFVISSWILFWLYKETGDVSYFYVPFATVVFADPAAALIGKNFPVRKYTIYGNTKSYGGSLVFFVVAFFVSIPLFNHLNIIAFLLFNIAFSLVLTVVEAVSFKGWDNFTIPLAAVIMQYVFYLII